METMNSYEGWIGTDAHDVNGDKVGRSTPSTLTTRPGGPNGWPSTPAYSGRTSPSSRSRCVYRADDEGRPAAFDENRSKTPPGSMKTSTSAEERELWSYYGFDYAQEGAVRLRATATTSSAALAPTRTYAGGELTRSEEQLRVAKDATDRQGPAA